MNPASLVRLMTLSLVLVTGCSALPGLGVLTGQDSGEGEALRALEAIDFVMADKTGATDPSLIAAADRIEAATNGVDIIEIRRSLSEDAFVVNLLFMPSSDPDMQSSAGQVDFYTSIKRAIELTWRGTVSESEGSGLLQVNLITPWNISTLDSGQGFAGVVFLQSEIERRDALSYLRGPRDLVDFFDLVAEGTLLYESPEGGLLYNGEPNHPLFLLNAVGQAGQGAS